MIVIFSSPSDASTIEVCRWLNFYKADYRVIYDSDFFDEFNVSGLTKKDMVTFLESLVGVSIIDIDVFWCRKWGIPELVQGYISDISLSNQDFCRLFNSCVNEMTTIWKYFLNSLPKEKIFGHFYDSNPNKLEQLTCAESVGLKIPKSFITCEKAAFENYNSQYQYITKALHQAIGIKDAGESYTSLTSEISKADISDVSFLPSFIQQKINKQYELRIFFIENTFSCMAIFSQNNDKTKIDFRRYDSVKPNRLMRYNLPKEIEYKLIRFCSELNLKTGSIDMIVTENNEFIFLEVNPFGQFGMLSKPNNFPLEQNLAKYLISHDKKTKTI